VSYYEISGLEGVVAESNNNRWLMRTGAVAVVALLFLLVHHVLETRQWHIEQRAIEMSIRELGPKVPQDCFPDRWAESVNRTEIAFGNIAFDPSYINLVELKLLRKDVEVLLSTTAPSPELLRRNYDRIGASSPTTKIKSKKWRQDFEETIARSYRVLPNP